MYAMHDHGHADDDLMMPFNRLRPGPSPREGIDLQQVSALAELDGAWEPIVVRRGSMEVLDGRHRLAAAKRLGHTTVRVRFFEGDDAEARVEAIRLNVRHGLPLSLGERTSAARELLGLYPEWSDRQLGTTCGLSPRTVARLRKPTPTEPAGECLPFKRERRVGKDGRRYPTDPTAQRDAIRRVLEEDRHASLRSVAARTGASPETVRSVRLSLAAEEEATAEPPVLVVPAATEERPAWLEDSACSSTEEGQSFAQWFDDHHIDEAQLHALADAVPISRVYGVIDEARRRMALWDQFAQTLQQRVHSRTPSGRVAERWGSQPAVVGAFW
jgi:ParB-like chromosome segregation protein Spo0J